MEKTFRASAFQRSCDNKDAGEYPHSELTSRILGAAVHVHRQLGPGFLEKMYENALCLELTKREIAFERQAPVRVTYEGEEIGMHRLGFDHRSKSGCRNQGGQRA